MRLLALASARKLMLAVAASALLALASTSSLAQDDPPAQAGRLSYTTGAVSIQQAGSDDWGQAFPNLPLGPGDRIFTDSDGRAELQIGQTWLRLGPNSDVSVVDISDDGLSFGVAQGSVHLNCHGLWQGQSVNINTPSGSASLAQEGDLRIDVMPNEGAAIFTAFSSQALITGAGGYGQYIEGGQALELAGTNPVYPQWLQPSDPDSLDLWSRVRDRQMTRASSYRYVSPEIPGAEELDESGTWMPGTEYGAVWFPNDVGPGWSPYHNGHWVNHAPWGWVWVEDESWGYAPFHYGRWVNYSGRWGWVPGPPAAHPVWSPALVVFAGGIHIGGVGISAWFPLGPGEAYRPWYHASPRYIDRVNISNISEAPHVHVQNTYVNVVNVTNVTNITYVNQTIGVTAVKHEDFAAGRSAQQTAVHVDSHQFDHVQVLDRPEPRPLPQPVIVHPPVRAVPVAVARPVLINQQGKMISAQPGARPVDPPVKAAPPVRALPGRVVVAPPPPGRVPPAPANPANPANPAGRTAPATPPPPFTQPIRPQPRGGMPPPAPTTPAATPTPATPAPPFTQPIRPQPRGGMPPPAPTTPAATPTPAPAPPLTQPIRPQPRGGMPATTPATPPPVQPATRPAAPPVPAPRPAEPTPAPQNYQRPATPPAPAPRPQAEPPARPAPPPQVQRPAPPPVQPPPSRPAVQPPPPRPAVQPPPPAAKPATPPAAKPQPDKKTDKDKKDEKKPTN